MSDFEKKLKVLHAVFGGFVGFLTPVLVMDPRQDNRLLSLWGMVLGISKPVLMCHFAFISLVYKDRILFSLKEHNFTEWSNEK